jgi:hypothetical protein
MITPSYGERRPVDSRTELRPNLFLFCCRFVLCRRPSRLGGQLRRFARASLWRASSTPVAGSTRASRRYHHAHRRRCELVDQDPLPSSILPPLSSSPLSIQHQARRTVGCAQTLANVVRVARFVAQLESLAGAGRSCSGMLPYSPDSGSASARLSSPRCCSNEGCPTCIPPRRRETVVPTRSEHLASAVG